MLPCVSSVIDHRRRQNVVRTLVPQSAIASCVTFLFLPRFDVICDLLQNAQQHESKQNSALPPSCYYGYYGHSPHPDPTKKNNNRWVSYFTVFQPGKWLQFVMFSSIINQSINSNLNSHKHYFYNVEKEKQNTFKYIQFTYRR